MRGDMSLSERDFMIRRFRDRIRIIHDRMMSLLCPGMVRRVEQGRIFIWVDEMVVIFDRMYYFRSGLDDCLSGGILVYLI
jgi:hypothetical protein